MHRLKLPEIIDRSAAETLAAELSAAVTPGASIEIDGSQVSRIGQAGLQVMLSGRMTATDCRASFDIIRPSKAFLDAAALAGLTAYLGDPACSPEQEST
jgi:chemotaxis protein CheX